MERVTNYLIIGNGRVARHFRRYFTLLGLDFSSWARGEAIDRLQVLAASASHILLLISDNAIEPFIQANLPGSSALKIHFSGALNSPLAYGAHPLTTFNNGEYALEKYKAIPFVLDADAPDFARLLPNLPNTHVRLDRELKAKYHALCVLSGNFSCILWQKFFTALEEELNFPAGIGQEYLKQQTENLLADYKSALTGPLARGDSVTLEKNLAALAGDPFQEIYKSFVEVYSQIKKENR